MKKSVFLIAITAVFVSSVQIVTAQKLPVIKTTAFRKDTVSIIKYGAVADGITLNTKSINNAIDSCSKKGGGVVMVPRGFWLTGPIVLKNNVNLFLQRDAILQFTEDFDQYAIIETNWEGLKAFRNQSPVSATNATNIAITGYGIIDGAGDAWRMVKKDKLTEAQWKKLVASGGIVSEDKKTWYPSEKSIKGNDVNKPGVIAAGATMENVQEYKDFLRPNLLVFTKCNKVLLEGVTFQNSAAWCLHPLMSENITIRNISVKNPWYAQNGDGIDIESCSNVLLENSVFDVGDDGICIKSGRDEEGRKRAMPTQDVIVRNCVVYHAHGGFVVGSEMSGGARNLFVSNCTFIGTDIGLRFKTTRGRGGLVENVYINNINMKDIVAEAILFDMYYMAKDPVPLPGEKRVPPKVEILPVDETTPQFQNFYVKNVVCNGAEKAIFIRGIPEMHVKNIKLEDMVLQANNGIECDEASGIQFRNIRVQTKDTNPVLYVLNSDDVIFDKLQYNDNAALLMQIQGDRSSNIRILTTDTRKAKQKLVTDYGANEKMVEIDPNGHKAE